MGLWIAGTQPIGPLVHSGVQARNDRQGLVPGSAIAIRPQAARGAAGVSSAVPPTAAPHPRLSPPAAQLARFSPASPAIHAILPGMSQPQRAMNLHLVSDSTGETLNSMTRATLARFEDRHVVPHRWSLIRSRLQLDRVLEGLRHEPGPVLFTLVDRTLRHALEECCERLGVPCLSVLDQVVDLLQVAARRAGAGEARGAARAGRRLLPPHRRHALRAGARRRPGRGRHRRGGCRASSACRAPRRRRPASTWRTAASRRPTCRSCRAPPLPPELESTPCPVVGLTIEAERADRDPPPPPAADRRRRGAPGHQRLHRPGRGEGRDPGGPPALHAPGLAGDRRDAPLHRGDRGDRAATDGGVAPAPEGGARRRPSRSTPRPTCSAAPAPLRRDPAPGAAARPRLRLRGAARGAGSGRPPFRRRGGGGGRGRDQGKRARRGPPTRARRRRCWRTPRRAAFPGARDRTRW